ncbi:MAG: UvrD-helicase domain-containing protein [Polyangiaceae bacterium]
MPTTLFEKPAVLKSLPRDRHAVIEASAGTGKTFTIEHLVADIIVSTACDIDNVLVVTFTERATAELRARVRGLLRRMAAEDHRARLEEAGKSDEAWEISDETREKLLKAVARFDSAPIATIHGFCQRVLVEHAFLNRQLFETRRVDRRTLFGTSFRHVLRREISVIPELRELLLRWLEQSTVARLEELLAAGHEHRAPVESALPENASLAAKIVHTFLPRVAAHLDAEKRIRGVFDYDDLITGMRDTLLGPNGDMLATALREQYKFALIDEFQDTDEVQWAIFKKLFVERPVESPATEVSNASPLANQPCTLFVIGDPKQAIYAFRGADIYTYLAAANELREKGATFLTLGDNFRSSGPLIQAYNRILEPGAKDPFFSGSVRYDVPVRCAREDLVAEGPSGEESPVHLVGLPALATGEKYKSATLNAAFGRFIVDEIVSLLHEEPAPLRFGSNERRRVKADDIFVLTHKNADAESIAALLAEAGVPVGLARSGGLFEEPEAADVRDVLAAVVDPLSRSNRLKAWATPFFGVPWERLGDCAELPPDHPLFERLLSWKGLADQRRYDRLFQAMLDDGLVERELFFSDPERSLANYRRVIDALLEETARTHYAAHELLARVHALVTGRAVAEDDEIEAGPPRGGAGRVSVMTIHKSKGLEAPVVFVHGGFYARHLAGPVVGLHDKGRRVHLGELSKSDKEVYDRERREEPERLL